MATATRRAVQDLTDRERLEIARDVIERMAEEYTREHAEQVAVHARRMRLAQERAALEGRQPDQGPAMMAFSLLKEVQESARMLMGAQWAVEHRMAVANTFWGYRCPACRSLDLAQRPIEGIRFCHLCDAIFGDTTPEKVSQVVKDKMHPDPDSVPRENWRYYDLRILPSTGTLLDAEIDYTRIHGWFDPETSLILQAG